MNLAANSQDAPLITNKAQLIEYAKKVGATLQHGKVTGYNIYFVSQPKGEQPNVKATEATINVRLDIAPSINSQIKFVNMIFVPEAIVYDPCLYVNNSGYVSKPLSQYAALLEVVRIKLSKGYVGPPLEIQFLTGVSSGDIFVIY